MVARKLRIHSCRKRSEATHTDTAASGEAPRHSSYGPPGEDGTCDTLEAMHIDEHLRRDDLRSCVGEGIETRKETNTLGQQSPVWQEGPL
jgi:hypothetical protein